MNGLVKVESCTFFPMEVKEVSVICACVENKTRRPQDRLARTECMHYSAWKTSLDEYPEAH
jgi:hypothetical protein